MILNESWLVGGMTIKVMTTSVSLRQQNESSMNCTWLEKRQSCRQCDQKQIALDEGLSLKKRFILSLKRDLNPK